MEITPRTLIVFHYHLLRGGVRSALERSLEALHRRGWLENRKLHLLVGRKQGVQSLVERLRSLKISVTASIDPALNYRDKPWPDAEGFGAQTEQAATRILELADGPSLFWIHNATLGKNPLVTEGFKRAAKRAMLEQLPHRFLFHVHDFAECGRLENLIRLRRCWTHGGILDPYPTSGNIGYGVLNSADLAHLVQAGISRERAHYLPNMILPLAADLPLPVPAPDLVGSLSDFARHHGYQFHPERPRWTLPIRLIRRKNVLEAVLLSLLAPRPVQLLLTLDANSRQERPYADAVKSLVKRARLPMVIGFGLDLVGNAFTLEQLFESSEAIVSTSLLEGFGFAFLDGPLLGKPLVGRNLKEVTRDFEAAGFPSDRLYEAVQVPVARRERVRLLESGRNFARRMRKALNLPASTVDLFLQELERTYASQQVDFGNLDLAAQQSVIEQAAADPEFLRALRDLNPRIPEPVEMEISFSHRIRHLFGPEAHAASLDRCFRSLFESEPPAEPAADAIGPALLTEFFTPRAQRPLYGGW